MGKKTVDRNTAANAASMPHENSGSRVQEKRADCRKCAPLPVIFLFAVLVLVGTVLSASLFSRANADPQRASFPVEIADEQEQRQALVCTPEGRGPFAAVVFNHGSVVDQEGWPDAVQRGYRLDHVCEKLAAEGYFVFAPIRENVPRGRRFKAYDAAYLQIVLQALDYVKTLPGVDGSRIALAGFSMGGLVSFKVALERSDLRAVALLAPAFGRGLLGKAAKRADRLTAPMLVMVESSDAQSILRGVDILEKALGSRGKPLQVIRYNKGGGHQLFYDAGYWWDDLGVFLRRHLEAP